MPSPTIPTKWQDWPQGMPTEVLFGIIRLLIFHYVFLQLLMHNNTVCVGAKGGPHLQGPWAGSHGVGFDVVALELRHKNPCSSNRPGIKGGTCQPIHLHVSLLPPV